MGGRGLREFRKRGREEREAVGIPKGACLPGSFEGEGKGKGKKTAKSCGSSGWQQREQPNRLRADRGRVRGTPKQGVM